MGFSSVLQEFSKGAGGVLQGFKGVQLFSDFRDFWD